MKFSYDDDADVLYIKFADAPGRVTYIENENGDILRLNKATGEIVGVTIQLFMRRIKGGEAINIPEVGIIPFNSIVDSLLRSRKRAHSAEN
jgi:uncharacterized protein YuzE